MNQSALTSLRLLGPALVAPLLVAACATSTAEDDPTAAAGASPAQVASEAPSAGSGLASEPPAEEATGASASEAAAWLGIELTDSATGEPFTLGSLAGEVVAIEPMAIWCTSCRQQQDRVKEVYADIAAAGVRYISLGIDPGESREALADYAERRGYGWTFAVSPRELSRALSDLFGPQVLSAPSTPLIVLDPAGNVVVQTFGPHGSDEVLSLLAEAGAATA